MAATRGEWRLDIKPDDQLPPLFWLATVTPGTHTIDVRCGTSVRTWGASFFEGTWADPPDRHGPDALPAARTVFGSGIVIDDGTPIVITPSHIISGVFVHEKSGAARSLMIANSFAGLLTAADLELLPDFDYPESFLRSIEGTEAAPVSLPTSRGDVLYWFGSNLRIGRDGSITKVAREVETPFASFAEYRERLSNALASVLANADGYRPVVALSSGYDSTAVAALAAEHGCREAVTLAHGRRTRKSGADTSDSGVAAGERLGMKVESFDRLAYLSRADHVEAEFLATGMSGEDVVMSAFEPALQRAVLLTGTQGNGIWRRGGTRRSTLGRTAMDGGSLNEYRLRVDFAFVPLPVFGLAQRPSILDIASSPEMDPWSVGGRYDQPVSRRIAEEAGVPRGTFAVKKHAASALLHTDGAAQMSVATGRALRLFAESDGRPIDLGPRRGLSTPKRALLRLATFARLRPLEAKLKRQRQRLATFDGPLGNAALRWSVALIKTRYTALAPKQDRADA